MQKKFSLRLKISLVTSIVLIPLVILFGHLVFDDRKYYFISTGILLLTFVPFLLIFEGKSPKIRELVLIAVLVSIAVASRSAFFMVPQFKPVLAIVIISAIALGGEVGFLIGSMTAFVSNFFFGQGPWTVWQMFAFGLIGLLSGIFFKYGGILNFSSMIMATGEISFARYVTFLATGFPFDIIHTGSTILFLYVLYKPMITKIERVKTKYGLIQEESNEENN